MKLIHYTVAAIGLAFATLVQAGTLYVDKSIELLAVDGKVLKAVNTTPRDLRSGSHQFVFRYKNRVRDGGREMEYQTPPFVMTLDTLANDEIEILAPEIHTLSQADLYFENRNVWRVKYANGAIKTFEFVQLSEEKLPREAVQHVLDQYNKSQSNEFVREKTTTEEVNTDLLKSIQLLYLQGNDEQRTQIKEWILKQ